MSGIAGVFNVPSDPESFAVWSTVHANHHTQIAAAISRIYGLELPQYLLDPFTPGDEVWVYNHQILHNDFDAILGISGFDLTDIDWKDQGQLSGFIQLNANEHLQASNLLGIG